MAVQIMMKKMMNSSLRGSCDFSLVMIFNLLLILSSALIRTYGMTGERCEIKKSIYITNLMTCLGRANTIKVANGGYESSKYLRKEKRCISKYVNRLEKLERAIPNCVQESVSYEGQSVSDSSLNYYNVTMSNTINDQIYSSLINYQSLFQTSEIVTKTPVPVNHRVFIYPQKGVTSPSDAIITSIKKAMNQLKALPPSSTPKNPYPKALINPFNPTGGGIEIKDGFIFEMSLSTADMVTMLNDVNQNYPTMHLYLSYAYASGADCSVGNTEFDLIYTSPNLNPATKLKIGIDVYVDDETAVCTSAQAAVIMNSITTHGRSAIFVIGHSPSTPYPSVWTNNVNVAGSLMLYVGSKYSASNGFPENLAHNANTHFSQTWAEKSKARIIYGTGGASLSETTSGPVMPPYVGSAMDYVNVCTSTPFQPLTAGPLGGTSVNKCYAIPVPTPNPNNLNLLQQLQSASNVDWYIGY